MTSIVNSTNAGKIVQLAYRDAGLIQEGELPSATQVQEGLARLNDMVNMWQTQGLKLFTLTDTAIPLVAGTNKYNLTTIVASPYGKPLRVLQAYYLDTSNIRRPLVPLSWEEWLRLSQVTQTGQISSYFIDKQAADLWVYFWLVPDATAATGTCHVLLQNQVTTYVDMTDTISFPMEWFLALRWGLADELATGQPQAIMDRCERRAVSYRQALEDWDVEDAPTTFAPDQRVLYSSSRL